METVSLRGPNASAVGTFLTPACSLNSCTLDVLSLKFVLNSVKKLFKIILHYSNLTPVNLPDKELTFLRKIFPQLKHGLNVNRPKSRPLIKSLR